MLAHNNRPRRPGGARSLFAGIALLIVVVGTPALAGRILPENGKLASVGGFAYPVVQLGGERLRMSPGAKIFDTNNRIVMPPRLAQGTAVYYQTDLNGDLSRVWILTREELEQITRRPRK